MDNYPNSPPKALILWIIIGEWCNGSTTDSDSVCLGSNPGSPAKLGKAQHFLRLDRLIQNPGPFILRCGVISFSQRPEASGDVIPRRAFRSSPRAKRATATSKSGPSAPDSASCYPP